MLKLLIFAPFDKVIVSDDKLVSMIVMLEKITIDKPAEFPEEAVIPMQWDVVAVWRKDAEEVTGKKYEQRVAVFRPDEKLILEGIVEFTIEQSFNYRNIVKMTGFPVGMEGICLTRLFLREADGQQDWQQIAEYPIDVTHNLVEVTNEKSDSGKKGA